MPVLAAHLTTRWDRVLVALGSAEVAWHAEDARLTLDVARRLAARTERPPVVIADDEARVREFVDRADLEFRVAGRPGDVLLSEVRPADLVLAPAYLLPELPVHRRLRLAAALAGQNLAVVAGPGRLTLAPRSLPDAMDRMLGQHR